MRNAPKASLDTCAGGPLLHTWRAQTFELYVRIYIYISCIFDGLEPHLLTSLQNHGPSKYLKNWTTIGHPRQLQLTKVRPWAAWAVGSEWTRDILGQAQNLVLVRFCPKKGLKKCHLRWFYVSTLPLLYLLSSQVILWFEMFEPYSNHHSQG